MIFSRDPVARKVVNILASHHNPRKLLLKCLRGWHQFTEIELVVRRK